MDPVVEFLSIGTLLIEIGIIGSALLYAASRKGYLEKYWIKLNNFLGGYWKQLSFGLVLTATSGSLYMSQILEYTPCHLCWFQRIFMYPLVLLTGVALLFEKEDVHEYVLPMVMIGGSISIYHYSVQVLSKVSSGCSTLAVSCSDKFTYYFGYMTIPMFALTAFAAIGILLWKFRE